MSTTTQILFNSPALHSLKRDQLIKLCKIHSIKASGKNVELVEKLKQHAQTLPRDSPLSIAARGEGAPDSDSGGEKDDVADDYIAGRGAWNFQMPRPSEQWEVVMDSIEEMMEDSSSQGTLSSMKTLGSNNGGSGEFGIGGSKSTSVGSSIKALASSFGLKRHNAFKSTLVSSSSFPSSSSRSSLYQSTLPPTTDELTRHSTPYSSLPVPDALPQTDHLTFEPPALNTNNLPTAEQQTPLPGHSLRPGVPAPLNARLSLGLGLGAPSTPTRREPTTTIRLISNPLPNDTNDIFGGGHKTPQLKPFETAFDLVLGSPTATGFGFGSTTMWPHSDMEEKGIYPALPFELPVEKDRDGVVGSLSFSSSRAPVIPITPTRLNVPMTAVEPFVFGSPLPQHSVTNAQFKSAAASVLEEMNKRLREEGVDGVGMDLISKLKPGAHSQGRGILDEREIKALPKNTGMKEKFERMHEEEFKKMEGIDGMMKRKGMSPKKDMGEDRETFRKESAVGVGKKRKSSVLGNGTGRDRYGRRTGSDSAARRASRTLVISSGRRPRVLPGSFGEDEDEDDGDGDEKRIGKRVRVDPPAIAVGSGKRQAENGELEDEEEGKAEEKRQKEKEAIRRKLEMNKARRRSSMSVAGARGRVSVGRGGVLSKPKPSRFGFLSSAKSIVQNVWNRGKTATVKPAATTSIPKSTSRVEKMSPPSQVPPPKKAALVNIARPSTAVSATGGNKGPSLRVNREKEKGAISAPRARSPIPSFGTAPSTRGSLLSTGTGASSRSGSVAGVSSIGTRSSSSRLPSSGVSSVGSKRVLTGTGPVSTATGSSSSRLSSRLSSSRLLAPTVSSLAKTTRASTSGPGLKAVAGATASGDKAEALAPVTNSPSIGKGPWSPRPGGIFSKPLEVPSGIPTPAKKKDVGLISPLGGGSNVKVGHETAPRASEEKQDPDLVSRPTRQRSLAGRKPRISRSKVIAKLASQRAAGDTTGGNGPHGIPSHGGKIRSSLGARVQRSSFGGKGGSGMKGGAAGDVMMSAKKRARQSEYVRRSRAGVVSADDGGARMDVGG